jgi:RNA polymerase sigma factor (TIGR02999 family)
MDDQSSEVTRLLKQVAAGDERAKEELASLVFQELRRRAASQLRKEWGNHTWQPTELVNEAYMKLIGSRSPRFEGSEHFFIIASHVMRELLVDHARRKRSVKRGGKTIFVPQFDGNFIADDRCSFILDVNEALGRLEAIDPELSQVVELTFFGGLTSKQAGETLGICARTVDRRWKTARAFLREQLSPRR